MDDRAHAVAALHDAAARFLGTARVSPEQWLFSPPGAWSLSQITEHVAISCENIAGLLAAHLAGRSIERGATGVLDVEIPYLFYRGDEPPNVAAPSGTWSDPDDAAHRLAASVAAIASWADATALDLRSVGVRHPVFGVLDGVQWLLFAAAHLERHRAQALGLRAVASYPR